MKAGSLWLRALMVLALGGCARMPLAPPQPSLENLQALQSPQIAPVNVGEFVLAQGKPAAMDKSVAVRSNTFYSPQGDSFAAFLKEALTTELRTAGKYDPASTTVIRGWLIDNRLEAGGVKDNRAFLGAKFAVSRGERVIYEKELNVQSRWDSEFIGVVAIPTAINEYTALFRKLLAQLFADDEFRKATRSQETR